MIGKRWGRRQQKVGTSLGGPTGQEVRMIRSTVVSSRVN